MASVCLLVISVFQNVGFRHRSRTFQQTEEAHCCHTELPIHCRALQLTFIVLIWFADMLAVVSEILERGVSVNLYMFHGGTSFGFMNGAMDFGAYRPQVTSYGRFREQRMFRISDRCDSIPLASFSFFQMFSPQIMTLLCLRLEITPQNINS